MVERIIRAARNGEKYKMIIMIPSVPAFAGDLKGDDALGTRAIMEFQYDSINRGGHSIYEEIARAGVNPMDHIRFFNLRSYDRINASNVMAQAEQQSGVSYQKASEGFDAAHESSRGDYQAYRPPPSAEYGVYEMEGSGRPPQQGNQDDYNRYQQEAEKIGSRQGLGNGRWDSVSECYMLNGEDIRNVPWEGGGMNEMDAFVSEYVTSMYKLHVRHTLTLYIYL
jgi:phospholipase D1/2